MDGTDAGTVLVVALLLLGSIAGAGLVAAEDFASSSDGDLTNGEVIKVGEDDDDQVKDINYTFVIADHTPGKEVDARHFAVGLTENATLHRIKLYSEDFGYSNCEPDNTAAFGIDRNDDDPGTNTDVSLLTSFKSYTSEEDFIDIKYYKEEKLAGSPIGGSVYDQIVAAQNGCYDNPSEPGWYRINGTITGSTNGDTTTDYKIRDLSQWIYICDCSSRAEAEQQLGPPPGQDGSDSGDSGSGDSTPTATATATETATAAPGESTATATATVTATATPEATATATATATETATAAPSDGGGDGSDGGGNAPTSTATATPGTDGGGEAGDDSSAATATQQPAQGDAGAGQPSTPTVGDGPGFGVVAALVGALLAGVLALRRD
ncbi:PGF-CTERM sorting domain-containing protein [Haloglomus salinum]|uniref:PGF-CTERM sorting domain-containing protein n=1 Tax=Haloglomus salinum TaxID=2962673 RepID=UPI0020CA0C6B|nr:PGF-CTERM sorting domain-containing protein [Haloglomus salinum]